ncbi:MAG: hypothetical protein MJ174_05480 [Treponema sp.]|nr:hypothetical protein [Treponema sp.]
MLQLIVGIITLLVTIYIPVAIMNYQNYNNLTSMYMHLEFGQAIQAIVDFFHDDCNCDVSLISQKYAEKLHNNGKTLHEYRRLLNNYFWSLEMCRKSSILLSHKIKKEFTNREAWIIKVLIYMNKAIDEEEMFKDISSIRYGKIHKVNGINKYLLSLSNSLSKSGKQIK